jgi:hypothetical protein
MSVTTVVDFQPSPEVAASVIRRRTERARIRRAISVALMMLAMTAGIHLAIARPLLPYDAARNGLPHANPPK